MNTEIVLVIAFLALLAIALCLFFLSKTRKLQNKNADLYADLLRKEKEIYNICNVTQAIYFKTDLDGILLEISDSVLSIGGYKPDEIIGVHESNFYQDPSLREDYNKILIKEGYYKNDKLRLKKSDGSVKEISVCSTVMYNEKKQALYVEGVIQDVSAISIAEVRQKESALKLNAAIEYANIGITEIDVLKKEVHIDSLIMRELGYNLNKDVFSMDELIMYVYPDDRAVLIEKYEILLENRLPQVEFEFRVVKSTGQYSWYKTIFSASSVNENNQVEKVIGVHFSIDSEKTQSLAIINTKKKLEAIYNSVPVLLVIIKENLEISEINEAVLKQTEFEKSELLGKDVNQIFGSGARMLFDDLFVGGISEKPIDLIKYSFDSNENFYNQTFVRKEQTSGENVEKKYFNISSNLFYIEGEKRLLLTMVDITKEKRYVDEIEMSKLIIEENAKIKSDFISNMGYEVRTPINSILGFVHLLKSRTVPIEQKEKYIEIIQESSSKLLSIVENVMELSKVEFDEVEIRTSEFNLKSLLNDIGKELKKENTNKNINFTLDIKLPPDKTNAHSDSSKISQIVLKLVENSFKYTTEGEVCLGAFYKDSKFWIYVKDTGKGIENPNEIFTSSYTNELGYDDQATRLGISLKIVKSYVKALNGELLVESEPNMGSKFSFSIPEKEKFENNNMAMLIEDQFNTKKNVLIVEDEDYNCLYLKNILEMWGLDCLIAVSGEEALEIVKSNREINLVLMDLRLPGIDGFEASKQIKEMRPELKIIAQTAFEFDADEDELLEKYCDDYIQKPIISKLLLSKIEKIISKS